MGGPIFGIKFEKVSRYPMIDEEPWKQRGWYDCLCAWCTAWQVDIVTIIDLIAVTAASMESSKIQKVSFHSQTQNHWWRVLLFLKNFASEHYA